MGPTAGLDASDKRKILAPGRYLEPNPRSSNAAPTPTVPSLYVELQILLLRTFLKIWER